MRAKLPARPLTLAVVFALTLTPLVAVGAAPPGLVNVQILAVNDFHGNLQPPAGSSGRVGTINAGGAEYLATHIRALEATNPNTVVVSAGDMIGASPLLSALFHDEPTIEAFNEIGLDINAVGNHEFDEGVTELLRMQAGGCHPADGCADGDPFGGAQFQFLAANVVWKDTGQPIFPAYKIVELSGVKVGFIGMTLEGTPTIVTPSGISAVSFLDEADTANALIKELKKQKVKTIVVLIHEGGTPAGSVTPTSINECGVGGVGGTVNVTGPIIDIVNRLDDEVDVVISGHTHQPYNCVVDGKLLTSAYSFGRLVTDIDLVINPGSGKVMQMSANNVIVTRDVPLAADITSLIAKYNAVAAPIANRVIGSITADITRSANAAGESALGDVIADAQLAATAPANLGGAVVAFMNPGGIRADLTYASSPAGEGDGNVTFGESFTVQPFGNNLVTMSLTGAQIAAVLEQQWTGPNSPANGGFAKILQVSSGFAYTWDAAQPEGSRVVPGSIALNGVPLDPNASYRVTVNSFLADGGDGFTVLVQGTNRLGGAVDTDALAAYFAVNSPVPPGPQNRITRIN